MTENFQPTTEGLMKRETRGRNSWASEKRLDQLRKIKQASGEVLITSALSQCGAHGWAVGSATRYACWRCGLYHENSATLQPGEVVAVAERTLQRRPHRLQLAVDTPVGGAWRNPFDLDDGVPV